MSKAQKIPPWPSWTKVYERWQSHTVQDISILPFDFRHHYPGAPWICLKDGRQLLSTTNPMHATAYHLAVLLGDRSPEFIAAYKLNAWCIMNNCSFLQDLLAVYFKAQQDSAYDWWISNSRHLLPYVKGMRSSRWYYPRDCDLSVEWKRVVDLAAEEWSGVAEHLGILRIPEFMDRTSTEYKEAEAFYHGQYEERERAEYERLSKKFSQHVRHLVSEAEKPIVFVEGKLDAAYLTKAIRLFRGEKALSQIELHPIGDEDSSGGIGGGKDALNRAHQFLAAKPHLIKRKILLLYDSDVNKRDSNHKNLFVRTLPRNESNDKIKKGIENLLPKELFEPRFYISRKKFGDYGEITEIQSFDKERFCRYICEERVIDAKQERDDFIHFAKVVSLIFETILPNS